MIVKCIRKEKRIETFNPIQGLKTEKIFIDITLVSNVNDFAISLSQSIDNGYEVGKSYNINITIKEMLK
jgi:hypothetical protein